MGSTSRPRAVGAFLHGALALAALAAPGVAMAQQATITGQVTAAGTGQPLADGRVFLVGTNVAAATNAQGRYTLRNVPAGPAQVRVVRVGYQQQKKDITVTADGSVTLDFALHETVVQLQEMVTTATGEQRKNEVGNNIANLGDIGKRNETGTVTNPYDLLTAKAPGVVVLPGNQTGTAGTIRIRGVSSLSLSNAPIWVVDGVRFTAGSVGLANGSSGQGVSFLNALDPETIESIEIVKGPSAATLYGTDAANGVIVVTTKRGRVGPARWTWFGEGGLVQDRNHYMDTYAIWGHTPANPGTQVRCTLATISSGACVKDSVTSLNILSTPGLTPFVTGHRDAYGVQVSGGSEAVRYFVSGDIQEELGPIKMPQHDIDRFRAASITVRDESIRPERLQAVNLRANLNAALTPKLDLSISSAFVKTKQRVIYSDNSFFSLQYQSFMSPGFTQPGLGVTQKGSLGEDLMGNNGYTFGDIMQADNTEDIQRLLGSATANWRPFTWMQNDATLGIDLANRFDYFLCRLQECMNQGTIRQGTVGSQHSNNRNFSVKLSSTGTWQARDWLNLKTTVGTDYTNIESENTFSNGRQLPPGGVTVSQAAVITSAGNQMPTANKTLGLYIQEQVALRDRLYVTLAARSDQNSAFGTNYQAAFYPKASVSWIISDESFFPRYGWLNELRLRSAYGSSGVQPGATSALATYSAPTVNVPGQIGGTAGSDTPGLRRAGLGNPDLKPERSAEFEGGFDTRLLDSRVSFEFTYYSKQTHDALISQAIAPSAGPSSLTVLRNLGSIKNTGMEAMLNARLVDLKNLGVDVTLAGSHNTNKVISLGFDANGNPNPTNGTGATRDSVGLPVRGFFYRTYTFADLNSDGIITKDEVTVNPDFQYVGSSIPRDNASLTTGFELFNRKLRIQGMFDYKGGYKIFNSGRSFQCQQSAACPGRSNPNASLEDQAAAIAATATPIITTWGYLEDGSFIRFREVSATISAPASIARALRAERASLSLGARNLHVWTKFKGTDPEENYSTGDVQATFGSPAPRTYFTARLNLSY